MTDVTSWPTIEQLGLRSVTSLLDLFEIVGQERHRLESERRPRTTTLRHPDYGRVVIRDQRPLSVSKLANALTDMTVTEWLHLLNRKVFFWVGEHRVTKLLGASAYRASAHLVLIVDTTTLVAAREADITLAPINTGSAKSRRSERAVPMPDVVAGHLERLHRAYQPEAVEPHPDALVFAHPLTGEPLGHGRMYRRLRTALRAAGLDETYGWHNLRHSYGTALAAQGVPMRTLQEWMGHNDIQTTQRYADYCPNPAERDIVEAAFARGTNSGTTLPPRAQNSAQLRAPNP